MSIASPAVSVAVPHPSLRKSRPKFPEPLHALPRPFSPRMHSTVHYSTLQYSTCLSASQRNNPPLSPQPQPTAPAYTYPANTKHETNPTNPHHITSTLKSTNGHTNGPARFVSNSLLLSPPGTRHNREQDPWQGRHIHAKGRPNGPHHGDHAARPRPGWVRVSVWWV